MPFDKFPMNVMWVVEFVELKGTMFPNSREVLEILHPANSSVSITKVIFVVFIGSFDGYLYCLDTESGKEIWRFKTGGEIQHDKACLIHENIIYFSSFDNYLYAVNIETGKELWRFRTGKFGNSSFPALMNGRLYVGSREGILYCLHMNGKVFWRFKTKDV